MSGEEWSEDKGLNCHELNEDVKRRARSVLRKISNCVANNSSFVCASDPFGPSFLACSDAPAYKLKPNNEFRHSPITNREKLFLQKDVSTRNL